MFGLPSQAASCDSLCKALGRAGRPQPSQPALGAPALPDTGIVHFAPALLGTAETGAAAALAALLLFSAPAAAAESGVAYDPGAGGDLLKNVAGVAYLLLVAVFLARLLRRRTNSSLSQRWASLGKNGGADDDARQERKQPVKATPLAALWVGTQAGAMAYGMWLLSTGIDAYFARQALPDQYTAHNITVTIRTVTLGLTYLATFIFGVNAMGLFALAVQLLVRPETDSVDVRDSTPADSPSNDVSGG